MANFPLKPRRDFLRDVQNSDGGWGYFPGKRSWLEPTIYAALALHGTDEAKHARKLLDSWVLPSGGWRTSADVAERCWASALALTLYSSNGWEIPSLKATSARLVETIGSEGSLLFQIHYRLHPEINDVDCTLQGWPWRPGTTSWIEPTAHTIIGLRNLTNWLGRRKTPNYLGLVRRIDVAEQMMLQRRANDGGWNCGTRRVWGVDVPSYPETTALALIALRGNLNLDIGQSLRLAKRFSEDTCSGLALAWLGIALPLYGLTVRRGTEAAKPSQDVLLAALQCLAEDGSGQKMFCPPRTVERA